MIRWKRARQFGAFWCICAVVGCVCGVARAEANADLENAPSAVIVSENVATVHVPASIFPGAAKQDIQTTFVVRSASTAKKMVAITSSGLGDASFSLATAGAQGKLGSWETFLRTEVDQDGKRILMRLSNDLLPSPGSTSEGKVLVLVADAKPVEVNVKLDRSAPLLLTTFDWFAAIAVPAAVGAALAYIGTRITNSRSARTTALREFDKFKDDNYETLSAFFTNFYPTAAERSDLEFAQTIDVELRTKKILAAVAPRERKKLETALQKPDRHQITACLKGLFAEWKSMNAKAQSE